MDYFGIPKGRNIKIQKFIFGPYLPVLKNIGALCNTDTEKTECLCLKKLLWQDTLADI